MNGLTLFVTVAPSPPRLWIISVLMREVALTVVLAWLASCGPLPMKDLLKQSHL